MHKLRPMWNFCLKFSVFLVRKEIIQKHLCIRIKGWNCFFRPWALLCLTYLIVIATQLGRKLIILEGKYQKFENAMAMESAEFHLTRFNKCLLRWCGQKEISSALHLKSQGPYVNFAHLSLLTSLCIHLVLWRLIKFKICTSRPFPQDDNNLYPSTFSPPFQKEWTHAVLAPICAPTIVLWAPTIQRQLEG